MEKKPAYESPLYQYRAVGCPLDTNRLEDASYISMQKVLYELKCPNADCGLVVRTQGKNLKRLFDILIINGCPECKLQFGYYENGNYIEKIYKFKDGEIVRDIPVNGGRFKSFIIKRVICIAEDVFESFGLQLYQKHKDELTRQEADNICEHYYKSNHKI